MLPGCGGSGSGGIGVGGSGNAPLANPFLGNFASDVALSGTSSGTVNINVQNNGIVSGTLAIADPTRSVSPRVIFTAAIHGNANMTTGQYGTTGSYIETNKTTVPVTVSGNLPLKVGDNGTVVVQFGGNRFNGALFAGSLANPQPSPSPQPTPTPTASVGPPPPPNN